MAKFQNILVLYVCKILVKIILIRTIYRFAMTTTSVQICLFSIKALFIGSEEIGGVLVSPDKDYTLLTDHLITG